MNGLDRQREARRFASRNTRPTCAPSRCRSAKRPCARRRTHNSSPAPTNRQVPVHPNRPRATISPGQFVTKLEQNLSVGHKVWHRDFVAYSLPERWASTSATAWTARILLPPIRIPNDEFRHESAADPELTPERAVPSIPCFLKAGLGCSCQNDSYCGQPSSSHGAQTSASCG
jgi:hypothetical protein